MNLGGFGRRDYKQTTFDTVDRQILKQIIYNFEEQSPKIILLDILAIYECITL